MSRNHLVDSQVIITLNERHYLFIYLFIKIVSSCHKVVEGINCIDTSTIDEPDGTGRTRNVCVCMCGCG